MNKRRLEDALTVGKLIQHGNFLKKESNNKLNLIYSVNCITDYVTYYNDELERLFKNKRTITTKERSPTTVDSNLDQKVEILSLKFNDNLNLIATGDSNGNLKVKLFKNLI
jgi:hypothetical protein